MKCIYMLCDYEFYESADILFVSEDLDKVKKEYDKLEKECWHGYYIKKLPLDINISSDFIRKRSLIKHINWIEIDDYGNVRELKGE